MNLSQHLGRDERASLLQDLLGRGGLLHARRLRQRARLDGRHRVHVEVRVPARQFVLWDGHGRDQRGQEDLRMRDGVLAFVRRRKLNRMNKINDYVYIQILIRNK